MKQLSDDFGDTEIGEIGRNPIEKMETNELVVEIPSVKKDIAIAIVTRRDYMLLFFYASNVINNSSL